MRVLITGATGLVGTALVGLLRKQQVSINYLSTSRNKLENKPDYQGFYWNPPNADIDTAAFEDVDVIVHLAGASISKRWTASYKKEILESRVLSANLIYNTLEKLPNKVSQIVSASAIGIYEDSLSRIYDEAATTFDDGFLGTVVKQWEHCIDNFELFGIRTCKLRTGLVLSGQGGALPVMARPISYGLGAAFGSGKQFQSWIHIDDLAALYVHAINAKLQGVYNAVAPKVVTNEELTHEIASVLHKPLFLPNIPRFVMKMFLGEMHQLLFSSQNVAAGKIIDSGFTFKYPTEKNALEDIYKKSPA